MDEITVWKASRIREDDPEPHDVLMRIQGDIVDHMPPKTEGLDAVENTYRSQAMLISSALSQLPQGTRWQLLILLMGEMTILYRGK